MSVFSSSSALLYMSWILYWSPINFNTRNSLLNQHFCSKWIEFYNWILYKVNHSLLILCNLCWRHGFHDLCDFRNSLCGFHFYQCAHAELQQMMIPSVGNCFLNEVSSQRAFLSNAYATTLKPSKVTFHFSKYNPFPPYHSWEKTI